MVTFFVIVTQLEGTQAFGINSLVNDALQSINVHWCHSRPSGTTFGGHGFLSSLAPHIQQAFEIAFFQAHNMPNPSKLLTSKQKNSCGEDEIKRFSMTIGLGIDLELIFTVYDIGLILIHDIDLILI